MAVKVFKHDWQWFALQEASIAERIAGHPRLVRLVDAVTNPQTKFSYLVYEFAGPPLTDVPPSAEGQLAKNWVLVEIARHTLEGLSRLHDLGLYHTDVQPSNIMVRVFLVIQT